MKFCTNCGNQINAEAAFCTNCGQRQVVSKPVETAPVQEPAVTETNPVQSEQFQETSAPTYTEHLAPTEAQENNFVEEDVQAQAPEQPYVQNTPPYQEHPQQGYYQAPPQQDPYQQGPNNGYQQNQYQQQVPPGYYQQNGQQYQQFGQNPNVQDAMAKGKNYFADLWKLILNPSKEPEGKSTLFHYITLGLAAFLGGLSLLFVVQSYVVATLENSLGPLARTIRPNSLPSFGFVEFLKAILFTAVLSAALIGITFGLLKLVKADVRFEKILSRAAATASPALLFYLVALVLGLLKFGSFAIYVWAGGLLLQVLALMALLLDDKNYTKTPISKYYVYLGFAATAALVFYLLSRMMG